MAIPYGLVPLQNVPIDEMNPADAKGRALQAQVNLILSTQGLGRSPTLERLLRFLLDNALEGRAPKETEIAGAVWDRLPTTGDADASVRVYIHRLRQKLEKFYAGPGCEQAWRLILPKGSYLLGVEPMGPDIVDDAPAEPVDNPAAVEARPTRRVRPWLVVAMVFVAAMAGWTAGAWHRNPDQIDVVQASALWRPLLDGDRRIALVLGDYYIFGERDDQGNISRLIREFDVNSARDLDELRMMDPARASRYTDIDLAYLPVGVGAALRSVAPVLRARGDGAAQVQVVTTSQLSVQTMQNTSLVYLGYLSGLGILRSPLLGRSRFAIGSSFDEIIDRKSGRHYLASSHLEANDVPGEDFALISSVTGVTGNRIIIIAGTRDAALMQAAEFATRPATLARLESVARGGQSFEALLGISAIRNVGLEARLIAVSPRPNPTWRNDGGAAGFPDEFPSLSTRQDTTRQDKQSR